MINQQMLEGHWTEIKGKLKERWGALTDDDLQAFQGSIDQLVGTIQSKTGETRDNIEEFLHQATSQMGSTMERARESARQYAQQASSTIQQASRQAIEGMRHGYSQASHMVQDKPGQSLAVALGAGLFIGVLLGLVLRPR